MGKSGEERSIGRVKSGPFLPRTSPASPAQFTTQAFTAFALLNHLIRKGAVMAGCGDPEAADFPIQIAPGYIGAN
jgi:hypothetical protein